MYRGSEAALGATVFADIPLAFPFSFDASAVDQEMQRAIGALIWDGDRKGLLTLAQRAVIRNLPVGTSELQQALHKACHLSQRQAAQHFDRQTCLNCRISVARLTATLAGGLGLPIHREIKPYLQ